MIHSEIAQSQIIFAMNNVARKFLKARDAVVKNKHASAMDDLKKTAREHQNTLGYLIRVSGCEINAAQVAAEFCGYGREWQASAKAVQEAADLHGISLDEARDMLEATMAQAQLHSQVQRGRLVDIFMGWLSDVDAEDAQRTDEGDRILAEAIQKAYATAGQWLRRDEGVLIEGDAEEHGITLPFWKDVLPKKGEHTTIAKERIRRNNAAREEAAQKQYVEAMREIEF